MNILALDVATHCGWASGFLYMPVFDSGVWDFTPKRDESGSLRLLMLKKKLQEVYSACPIDLVVFEAHRYTVGFQRRSNIAIQFELQGVVKLFCEENGVASKGYSSTDIKKFATGKGNAKKPAMIEAAVRLAKRVIEDDNEADAICLLSLAKSEFSVSEATDPKLPEMG